MTNPYIKESSTYNLVAYKPSKVADNKEKTPSKKPEKLYTIKQLPT
jgi:hypothetical protein